MLRQHGTPHYICGSVFALVERKNRTTKEDKVPLCRRLDRRLRKPGWLDLFYGPLSVVLRLNRQFIFTGTRIAA
jgi:hypothetical protein